MNQKIKSNNKLIVISIIIIFIILTMLIFSAIIIRKLNLNIDIVNEIETVKAPRLSYMMVGYSTDEEIYSVIDSDNDLVNERCYSEKCDLGYRTPLVTAIILKRYNVSKYLIKNGADVDEAISIIENSGIDEWMTSLDELMDQIGDRNFIDAVRAEGDDNSPAVNNDTAGDMGH